MCKYGACWRINILKIFSQLKQNRLYLLVKLKRKQARLKKYIQYYNTERIKKCVK